MEATKMKASIIADLNGKITSMRSEARFDGRTNVFGNKTTRTLQLEQLL